jgi:glycosyltransferase involved in cell wall biosynthesis
MIPGVTVVIPSIPPREAMRERAKLSAWAALTRLEESGLLPDVAGTGVVVANDERKLGAARTRHLGLMNVQTEYVAFLDDDDVMLPDHLEKLYAAALEHQADYLWSRFVIVHSDGSLQPGPAFLGEDFEFTTRCRKGGAEFWHVPAVTWHWHHHGRNTSGLPDRW